MSKTEILSNIGVGSGINTTELIKALVDADTAPQKQNLDKLVDSVILQAELLDLKTDFVA